MKKPMIALLWALLFVLPLAQAQYPGAPNGLSFRASFTNFAFPYTVDPLAPDYTFGLEVGYLRSLNNYLNLAVPAEVGLARYPVSETVFKNPPELMGNLDVHLQLKYCQPDRFFYPYAFAGLGGMMEDLQTYHLVVPAGLGLNVRLWKHAYVGAQAEYRYAPISDLRDNFQFSLGWTFILNGKEGSVTSENPAPTKKDSDADGIVDAEDACPDQPGTAALLGCPDRDGDGVADNVDRCPDQPGKLEGCPDQDQDGVADVDDACPDRPGTEVTMGCPDGDGDGVADGQDQCPEFAGTPETDGCPDTDGDGIADGKDACPNEPGELTAAGCPDRDKDGVVDSEDRCPNTAGVTANGCPEITSQDQETLDFAMKAVQFETGSDILLPESYAALDQIEDILRRYADFSLRIEGHTDSIGSRDTNQKLSEQRAKACYDYLVEKGIDPNRLSYQGYGESQPIANNKYKEGREKNRRVEFDLYLE